MTISYENANRNVNAATNLRVLFTLADTISATDIFRFQLPVGTRFVNSFRSSTTLGSLASTYNESTQIVEVRQLGFVLSRSYAGTAHNIVISSYTMPPSTRPTDLIRFSVLNVNGFEKMVG